MLESFNSDTRKLRATNQDLKTYTGSVKKERAEYPEHNTLHFENVANITADSDIITPHKKQNGGGEDSQEDHQIPL